MDDIIAYEKLRELIQQKYPLLNKEEIARVYKSVIECVNFKEHVRRVLKNRVEPFIKKVWGKN